MQCWTADSQEMYQLVDACGSGGEGTTYQVEEHPELVAKIYNAENLERHFPGASGENEWTMREKIFHMISVRPSLHLTVPQFGDSIDAVAWPTEALFDSRSYFIGFLMPKVEFAVSDDLGITDLHCAYREWERQHLFGERYSWLTAIKIATNLAAVVQCLHENDIVIGDFNCNNILIDKWGHVTLIDADSLCIHNRQRNITYRCIVGVGEFLAPELQGIALDDTRSRRSFTEESDCFSLAIHIFMLLMNGTHPFSGAKTGDMRQASSSMEPYTKSIANGECPYVTNSTFMPFANTPKVTHLPYYIRDMFDRAFGYATPDGKIPEKTIASRPTAAEWRGALKQLYDDCTTSSMVCSRDSSHVNLPKNDTCMWCEAEGVLTPLKDVHSRRLSKEETKPAQIIVEEELQPTVKTETQPEQKHMALTQVVSPVPVASQPSYMSQPTTTQFGATPMPTLPKPTVPSPAAASPVKPPNKVKSHKLAVFVMLLLVGCIGIGIGIFSTSNGDGQSNTFSYGNTVANTKSTPPEQALAEQGDADAQNRLGSRYYSGDGVEQDYATAVKWYRAAAEQGNADGQFGLGFCYYSGDGVGQDYQEAVKWFRAAAEQGNAGGQFSLGVCYEHGDGVEQDYQEAVKWYRAAAEQGDADGQYNLGVCYYNGDGVEQDYQEAVKWFRAAAEQGNAGGQFGLGICYYNGDGVEQDYQEAVKWWQAAAEQGNEDAQAKLNELGVA